MPTWRLGFTIITFLAASCIITINIIVATKIANNNYVWNGLSTGEINDDVYIGNGEKTVMARYGIGYNKAGIAKSVFSKIKSDSDYHPTKETALAFAVALHLNLEETSDLIGRAGYTISHSSESDLIVEYFIEHRMWNIDEINYQLDFRGHKTLTNWRKTKD